MAAGLALQIEEFLNRFAEENPDRYFAALGSKFVEFVGFAEKMFRGMHGRIKKLEEQTAALEAQGAEVMKILMAAAEQAQGGAPVESNGHAAEAGPPPTAQRRAMPKDPRGMVRLGGDDNHPLTPEEQEVEEKMDLAMKGEIDMSRYVPADHPAVQAQG